MKILVLSDNHYKNLDIKNKYDFIIHAGDYGSELDYLENNNIIYVKGNCDYYGDKERILELYNKKILLTHGDKYRVKETYQSILYKGLQEECDIVIFGHTHIPLIFIEENILFINPGSFKDGYYIIIDENKISLYKDDKFIKKLDYRW
ncbi:MAG: metallophosphoesterase [Acholeplasmatales bacterium]|nr:metallophosphoesterase [Acholeplasmatales bacterium]